jgi:hypothetical protein
MTFSSATSHYRPAKRVPVIIENGVIASADPRCGTCGARYPHARLTGAGPVSFGLCGDLFHFPPRPVPPPNRLIRYGWFGLEERDKPQINIKGLTSVEIGTGYVWQGQPSLQARPDYIGLGNTERGKPIIFDADSVTQGRITGLDELKPRPRWFGWLALAVIAFSAGFLGDVFFRMADKLIVFCFAAMNGWRP